VLCVHPSRQCITNVLGQHDCAEVKKTRRFHNTANDVRIKALSE